MKRFEVKFECPEEFDGEYGYFVITAVRTGRKWKATTKSDTETAGEQLDVLEPMLNDGEKLDPKGWKEITL
jgi:hypothetical protein